MDESEKKAAPPQATLVRSLGVVTGTLLVAGVVIGSGVFKKIVPLAQTGLSEEWILAAWVVAGLITMGGAFNLAALASLTQESGGIYEYLRLCFGGLASFLFGWTDFAIIGSASVAALGFIFAQTVNSFLPLPNPLQAWAGVSIGYVIYPFADSGIKLLALGAIGVLTGVNYRGVAAGGLLGNVFTGAKILGLLLLIVVGIFVAAPAQVAAVRPGPATAAGSATFFSAFFSALLSIFWAYDGWVDLSFITGEMKNPARDVPRAIVGGVAIAIGLYVLVNYAYLHVLPLPRLAAVRPNEIGAAVVAQAALGQWGKTGVTLLIMVSVFGTLNAVLLSHSRIYFRMAQERFFFRPGSRGASALPHAPRGPAVHAGVEQRVSCLRHVRPADRYGHFRHLPFLWPGGRGGAENEAPGQAQRARQGLPFSPGLSAALCPHLARQYRGDAT